VIRCRVALPFLLAAALLWAPLLGQLHRITHGPAQAGLAAAHQHEDADDSACHGHHHPAHAGWLGALFGGHDQGAEGCRLYDQLTQADTLPGVPLLVLPLLLTPLLLRRLDRDAVARRAALFDARGPPPRR